MNQKEPRTDKDPGLSGKTRKRTDKGGFKRLQREQMISQEEWTQWRVEGTEGRTDSTSNRDPVTKMSICSVQARGREAIENRGKDWIEDVIDKENEADNECVNLLGTDFSLC